MQIPVTDTMGPNKLKCQSLEQRKVYYRFIQEMGGSCPRNPEVTESFQQVPLKAKGEGWVWLVVADFLSWVMIK